MKGYQRNFPCPCGSGLKWKSCHPTKVGIYKDKDGKVVKDRKPINTKIMTRKELEEQFGI